jgi:hypothetical protein
MKTSLSSRRYISLYGPTSSSRSEGRSVSGTARPRSGNCRRELALSARLSSHEAAASGRSAAIVASICATWSRARGDQTTLKRPAALGVLLRPHHAGCLLRALSAPLPRGCRVVALFGVLIDGDIHDHGRAPPMLGKHHRSPVSAQLLEQQRSLRPELRDRQHVRRRSDGRHDYLLKIRYEEHHSVRLKDWWRSVFMVGSMSHGSEHELVHSWLQGGSRRYCVTGAKAACALGSSATKARAPAP